MSEQDFTVIIRYRVDCDDWEDGAERIQEHLQALIQAPDDEQIIEFETQILDEGDDV